MKKILHCINDIKTYGGAERIVSKMINTHYGSSLFEVYPSGVPKNIFYKFFYFIFSGLKLVRMCKEYDVVHFHLFPSFYLSVFIPSCKVIIHEHNTHNKRRELFIFKFIESYIYKRAKVVVCISDATKNSLSNWIGHDSNLIVIPNFSRFDYSFEQKSFCDSTCVNLLMVASFTEQKRQSDLILAVQFLPDNFVVHFVGDGPFLSEALRLSINLNLSDRIFFHGNVDGIEEYYKRCDFCVLLSNWEGFGLVVVEAASFNKVTIGSKVSGLSSIIGDECLLVDNSISPFELANRIISLHNKLLIDSDFYIEYCKRLSMSYSYSSFIEKINYIYEN